MFEVHIVNGTLEFCFLLYLCFIWRQIFEWIVLGGVTQSIGYLVGRKLLSVEKICILIYFWYEAE